MLSRQNSRSERKSCEENVLNDPTSASFLFHMMHNERRDLMFSQFACKTH